MPEIITDSGREWCSEKLANEVSSTLNTVAVGDGTTDPQSGDSSLENRLHEETTSSSTVVIETSGNTGEIEFRISISGGTEVPAGSSITEIGVKTSSGILVWRGTRDALVIDDGDRKTLQGTLNILDN